MRREYMQFSYWLIFLVAIGLAILAIQNSTAPKVVLKFLFWKFETSLIYMILGSFAFGMIIILLLWISAFIRASFRDKNLKKEIGGNEMRR
jgi:uncharacterized integral membrane protein